MAVYVHRTGMEKCVEKCPPLIITVPLVNKKIRVLDKHSVACMTEARPIDIVSQAKLSPGLEGLLVDRRLVGHPWQADGDAPPTIHSSQ
jgi:hypothetical protein